jgi:hypothetical protein
MIRICIEPETRTRDIEGNQVNFKLKGIVGQKQGLQVGHWHCNLFYKPAGGFSSGWLQHPSQRENLNPQLGRPSSVTPGGAAAAAAVQV